MILRFWEEGLPSNTIVSTPLQTNSPFQEKNSKIQERTARFSRAKTAQSLKRLGVVSVPAGGVDANISISSPFFRLASRT